MPARAAASLWSRRSASSGETMPDGPQRRARSSGVAVKYTADLPHPVRCTTSARLRSETRARIAVHWSSRRVAAGPASARRQLSASARSEPAVSVMDPWYQQMPTVAPSGRIAGVTDSWTGDDRAVRAFRRDPDRPVDLDAWPATVPAIAQILADGLELPAGLTVLVGENGSGKATVVETLAEAYGLNAEGGAVQGRLFRTRDSEPGIGSSLVVERGPNLPRPRRPPVRPGAGRSPGGGRDPLTDDRRGPRRGPPGTGPLGHPRGAVGRARPRPPLAPVPLRARLIFPPPAVISNFACAALAPTDHRSVDAAGPACSDRCGEDHTSAVVWTMSKELQWTTSRQVVGVTGGCHGHRMHRQ